ncbi:S-DNA-T family DNA segregation ATPase FtsK/SpoIIIE [Scopulibacillus daqui]|uniref:S-DNA-T family DNA segregation ATPase FtsK/SpoIIIE n=1 Tax=Scopulibacillus daqui TaxID=1469162 RepID=A0ABS2PV84_9BACL|nr:type VII secretion protein EssC [Scopulibacillus daqui]MBM7643962.1 S-DNA-T family DNA segregation ATPase FtsK/SpoIIIE [Scopulibacillus daqui]
MRKSPYFKRSPRLKLTLPTGKIIVHNPKREPMAPKFSFETMVIPIFLTIATVLIMYYLSKTLFKSGYYALFMMAMSIPMLGSYIATIGMFFRKKKVHKKEVAKLQNEYLQQIDRHREEIEEIRDRQVRFLREMNPNPDDCVQRIHERDSALWERTPNTEDFLNLRIGLGTRPFQINIRVPEQDGYDVNPLIAEAQKLKSDYRSLAKVPVTIPLKEKRVVGLVGDRQDILELARVLILQLVTHHSPEEVKLAAAYEEQEKEEWHWMRWLPHIWDENRESRFIAEGDAMARKLFEKLYSTLNIRKLEKGSKKDRKTNIPEYIFLLPNVSMLEDDGILPLILNEGENVGACTFIMAKKKEDLPMECELIIEVQDGVAQLYETFSTDDEIKFTGLEKVALDHFSLVDAKAMAREIAPLRVKQSIAGIIPKVLTFLEMYHVNRVEELDVISKWNKNRCPLTLPVPIGVREGRKEVTLNIHDKIEKKGQGPHGLMAGTTGSGKSEVIQSLILSLAVNYHPHEMAFMLIDYKGGGMSNTFQGLPHVIATITNLEDPQLISRAKTSLRAELERRQKLFNMAGNIQHIDEYFQSEWRKKEPLPHLFIIIDEFAQLKKDQPEFMDELISIAAIGRTLGVHLLLATQKPAGVVDEKIWSNSRFRICLRVQDDNDSREMIQIPNASRINVPGRGYFQVGNNEVLEYFQSAWSGADYQPKDETESEEIVIAEVNLDGSTTQKQKIDDGEESHLKQIQVLIDYIKEEAEKHNIKPLPGPWQEPLPEQLPLSKIVSIDSWTPAAWEEEKDWLEPNAGIIDDVKNQAQYPLKLDLNEGHLIIYGMPGSGKTTFLQSILMSLFFNHAPRDLHVYIIDFSRQMREFAKFPHVGSVVHEDETEKMQRMLKFFLKELSRRKELFASEGVGSLKTYRSVSGADMPALILMIDGYQRFKTSFQTENEQLEILLREGATYGLIVLVTVNQTNDIFERYRSNFVSAVSFELADHTDYYYAVGRPDISTENLPEGRGFVKGQNPPQVFQAMLPYDGVNELERVAFIRRWSEKMAEEWHGEPAKEIAMLPKEISLDQLMSQFPPEETKELPFGLDVEDLECQTIQLDEADHVFVTGRVESGKTSLLQTLVLSLAYQYSPDGIDLYFIELEPKLKGLMTLAKLPHVKGCANDLSQAKELIANLAKIVDERKQSSLAFGNMPGFDDDEETYAPLVIVIDDVDNLMQQMNMDFEMKDHLDKLTKQARLKNVHFLIAGTLSSINTSDPWFMNIKKKYVGFLLGSTLNSDLYFFNIRLPHSETDKELPAGDGYMIKGRETKVKIAMPFGHPDSRNEWLNRIYKKYAAGTNKR